MGYRTATSAEIEQTAKLIDEAAVVLRRLADSANLIGAALSEVRRHREALKHNEAALN